jgi:hypothetical protein
MIPGKDITLTETERPPVNGGVESLDEISVLPTNLIVSNGNESINENGSGTLPRDESRKPNRKKRAGNRSEKKASGGERSSTSDQEEKRGDTPRPNRRRKPRREKTNTQPNNVGQALDQKRAYLNREMRRCKAIIASATAETPHEEVREANEAMTRIHAGICALRHLYYNDGRIIHRFGGVVPDYFTRMSGTKLATIPEYSEYKSKKTGEQRALSKGTKKVSPSRESTAQNRPPTPRPEPKRDLTEDGDVEKNPGPTPASISGYGAVTCTAPTPTPQTVTQTLITIPNDGTYTTYAKEINYALTGGAVVCGTYTAPSSTPALAFPVNLNAAIDCTGATCLSSCAGSATVWSTFPCEVTHDAVTLSAGDELRYGCTCSGSSASQIVAVSITEQTSLGNNSDVTITGINQLNNPLWVSLDNPGAPPIYYSLFAAAALLPVFVYVWYKRKKRMNKEKHILNGNIVTLFDVLDTTRPIEHIDNDGKRTLLGPEKLRRIEAAFIDWIDSRSTISPDFQNGALRIVTIWGGDDPWAVLREGIADTISVGTEWDVDDDPFALIRSKGKDGAGGARTADPATQKRGDTKKSSERAKTDQKPRSSKKPNDVVAQARRYVSRIERVASMLSDRATFVRWIMRRDPPRRFARAVLLKAFGSRIDDGSCSGAILAAYEDGWTIEREARELMNRLDIGPASRVDLDVIWDARFNRPYFGGSGNYASQTDRKDGIDSVTQTRSVDGWVRDLTNDGDVESNPGPGWIRDLTMDGDVESNPGPGYPRDMAEVKQLTTVKAVMNKKASGTRPFNPQEVASRIGAFGTYVNPTVSNVSAFSLFRATIMTNANNLLGGGATYEMAPPESVVQPRAVRNGTGAALIASTNRLSDFGFVLHQSGGMKLSLTDTGREYNDMAASSAITKINQNQQTLAGFPTVDLASLVADRTTNDLNMESFYAKLLLLMSVAQTVPQTTAASILPNTVQNLDPWTVGVDPAVVSIASNNSTLFGEDCGGSTSLFPYSNAAGTISFHICEATIPSAYRQNAIYLPSGLINTQANPQEAIAAIVMAFAEWPSVMWTVDMSTTDDAGGNAASQLFVHNASTVFIGGMQDIHVVLSRDGNGGQTPTSQATANNNVMVQPTSGPTASNSIAASTALNISYSGGVQSYSLAEYCYTWSQDAGSPAISQNTITQLIWSVSAITNTYHYLESAWDKVAISMVRYAPMVAEALSTATQPSPNAAWSWNQNRVDAFSCRITNANYPQTTAPPADMFIAETRPRAWSKVMSGLFRVEEPGPVQQVSAWLNHESFLYHLCLRARSFAPTFLSFYVYCGMSADTWQTALTQSPSNAFRQLVRARFANYAGVNGTYPASLGQTLSGIYEYTTGYSSISAPGSIPTMSAFMPPETNILTVYDIGNTSFLNNVLPVLLPDVWYLAAMSGEIPLELAPFPPGYTRDSLTGLKDDNWNELILGNGSTFGPFYPSREIEPTVGYNDLVTPVDYVHWNNRLVRHAGGLSRSVTEKFFDNSVVSSIVPSGMTVCAITTAVPQAVGNYVSSRVATCCTHFVARVTSSAYRMWPTWTNANVEMNRELLGASFAYIEAWQVGGVIIPPSVLTNPHTSITLTQFFPQLEDAVGKSEPSSEESVGEGSSPFLSTPAISSSSTSPPKTEKVAPAAVAMAVGE